MPTLSAHATTLSDAASSPMPMDEHRGTERTAVAIMRAAKLICQSGEYVCLIRDVSSGGVKLRMFHRMPNEDHVFLEMPDGEIYPIIRVWQRDNTAGFKFVETVNPAKFLGQTAGETARMVRIHVSAPAMVYANNAVRPATLSDISQGGAHVQIDTCLPVGQTLILSIDAIGEISGWVRWRRGPSHGIAFDVQRRLDELAAQALRLQPLRRQDATPAATARPAITGPAITTPARRISGGGW